MSNAFRVSAIAFEEAGVWVGQVVEYDIAAHAEQLADLPEALMRAVVENAGICRHLGREPMQGIKPAPQRFRDMFDAAKVAVRPLGTPAGLEFLPDVEMRLASTH